MNPGTITGVSGIAGFEGVSDDAEGKAAIVAALRDFVGIGEDFAALRRSVGVSVDELARYVPADRRSIEKLERGELPYLSVAQWQRLARFAYAARPDFGSKAA